ncbi:GNAT family N-acetyltransferase [Roseateles sp. BYS180W]|uniref:GNAT family N-acetyltransferase n=1 Tax=Roseateles rivi TaxID=3299028 RepID=A0ABW7FR38_9BURK
MIEELQREHLLELSNCLRAPSVYEYISELPTVENFVLDREIALRGPSSEASGEVWLNFLVRELASSNMIGRLEATLHNSIAEVAFLFNPEYWGNGFASESLDWLHKNIQRSHGISEYWAATAPENFRCQALLTRAGYRKVDSGFPPLYSYDAGDMVFNFSAR